MLLTLEAWIADLHRRLIDVERRFDNSTRHGVVSDVDAEKHLVRLKIGGTDDEPLKSPWLPYGQIAGAMKVHSPPSEGQNMTLFCPAGDFRQAVALPMTWNDANPSPSKAKDEHVLAFGDVRITIKSGSFEVAVGETRLSITGDEIVTYGKTRLNDGKKKVHRQDDKDTAGNSMINGADKVFA